MSKWYVNLPAPAKQGDPEGPELHLKAKRSVSSRIKGGSRSVKWEVKAVDDASGTETDLSRKAVALCSFASGDTTSDVKGVFTNTFKFAPVGGIKYTITCTKTAGTKAVKSTAEYTSWRRLFVTVYTMNALCKQVWKKLEKKLTKALEASYIELVVKRTLDTKKDETQTGSSDSNISSLYDSPSQTKGPHLALVFLDHFFHRKEQEFDKEITKADVHDGKVEFELPPEITTEVVPDWPTSLAGMVSYRRASRVRDQWFFEKFASGKKSRFAFSGDLEQALKDGEEASFAIEVTKGEEKKSFSWKVKGTSYSDASEGVTLSWETPGKILLVEVAGIEGSSSGKALFNLEEKASDYVYAAGGKRLSGRKVQLTLTNAEVLDALDKGRKTEVSFKLAFNDKSNTAAFVMVGQPFAGMSIFADDTSLDVDQRAEKVFHGLLHEIGHQLQLTKPTMTNYYTELGGQGPHCKKNCAKTPTGPNTAYPNRPVGEIMAPTADGVDICVMYHAIGHRGTKMGKFCELCLPEAQSADMKAMPAT